MIELNKIYNEDCLETMKRIDDNSIDLILTDPPYGINLEYDIYNDSGNNWYELINKCIPEMLRISKMIVMPCCKIKYLEWIYKHYPPDWLICWYKGSTGHKSFIGFNDWEPHLVYKKLYSNLSMHDYFQTVSSPKKNTWNHPCPKPILWATYLINKISKDNKIIIYDPFMGSGTTLVGARELNKYYIGSEISPEYCKIIENRLDGYLDFNSQNT